MAATARSLRVCARQHTWTQILPSSPGPMPLMAVKSSFLTASLAASISLAPTFTLSCQLWNFLAHCRRNYLSSKHKPHFLSTNNMPSSQIHVDCYRNPPICSLNAISLCPESSSFMMLLYTKILEVIKGLPFAPVDPVCLHCSWSHLKMFGWSIIALTELQHCNWKEFRKRRLNKGLSSRMLFNRMLPLLMKRQESDL